MARQLTDNAGASVTVRIERAEPISTYIADIAGRRAGRADFIDSPDTGERTFFHTEVDEQFGGRGIGALLLHEALADSVRDKRTVVPVCPLFARHLNKHGEEFIAGGGVFRAATRADLALVMRTVRGRSGHDAADA